MLLRAINIVFYGLLAINIVLGGVYAARAPIADYLENQLNKNKTRLEALLQERTGLAWQFEALTLGWQGLNPTIAADAIRACLPQMVDEEVCSLDLQALTLNISTIRSVFSRDLRLNMFDADRLELTIRQSGFDLSLAGLDANGGDASLDEWLDRLSNFKSVSLRQLSVGLVDKTLDWEKRSQWPEHSLRYYRVPNQGLFSFRPLDNTLDFISARAVFSDQLGRHEGGQTTKIAVWSGFVSTHFYQASRGLEALRNVGAPYDSMRMRLGGNADKLDFSAIVDSSSSMESGLSDYAFAPLILSGAANWETIFSLQQVPTFGGEQEKTFISANWSPIIEESLAPDTAPLVGGGKINLLERNGNLLLRFDQDRFFLEQAVDQFQLVFRPVGRLQQALVSLNPRGRVDYFHLELPLNDPDGFVATANLNGVSLDSFNGKAPAGSNIHGWVSFSRRAGALVLSSAKEPTSVSFPQVYSQPIQFFPKHAGFSWYIGADRYYLAGDELHIEHVLEAADPDGFEVKGRFYVDGRRNKQLPSSRLVIEAGAAKGGVKNALAFVPYRVNRRVIEWLDQSEMAGDLEHAAFLYNGSIAPKENDKRSITFGTALDKAAFNYFGLWPRASEVDAGLLVEGAVLEANIYQASIDTLDSLAGEVDLVADKRGFKLAMTIRYQQDAEHAQRFLLNSPLREQIPDLIASWQVSGHASGEVAIEVTSSASSAQNLFVQNDTTLSDVALTMPDLDITLDGVGGDIAFSTSKGFSGNGLRATLWGKPVAIDLGRVNGIDSDGKQWQGDIAVKAEGAIDISNALRWLDGEEESLLTGGWAKGVSGVSFDYLTGPERSELKIKTDLLGVEIDLPDPFYKQIEQPTNLLITRQGFVDDTSVPFRVGYGNKLDASVWVGDQGLERTVFDFYPLQVVQGQSRGADLPGLSSAQLMLRGYLPQLDVNEWLNALDRYQDSQADGGNNQPFEVAIDHLDIGKFNFLDWDMPRTTLSLMQRPQDITVAINNTSLKGRFTLPQSILSRQWACEPIEMLAVEDGTVFFPQLPENLLREERLIAEISRLQLDQYVSIDGDSANVDDSAVSSHWLNPSCMFPLTARVDEISYRERSLGSWQFSLSASEDVALLHNIAGVYDGLEIESGYDDGLRWAKGPDGRLISEFNGLLKSDSIDEALKTYFQADNSPIVAQSALAKVSLAWQGNPLDFSLSHALGTVNFELDDGRFVELSGAAGGFLKLVSLVNLQRYIERLSLDISNIYRDGVSFDRLSGGINLEDGVVSFVDSPIAMTASSSDFVLSGRADLNTSALEGELVATLPVSRNLPWLVAIAGGLPVAAGTFIATQALDEQINRFSSVVYTVTGEIENPQLQLKSIFDNQTGESSEPEKPKKKQKKVLELRGKR